MSDHSPQAVAHELLLADIGKLVATEPGSRYDARAVAVDILALVYARLSIVTPEMVEAWQDAEPDIDVPASGWKPVHKATADWTAMLASSPLTPGTSS